MTARFVALVALQLGLGCIRSDAVICADGSRCSSGSVCTPIDGAILCLLPDVLARCAGLEDDSPCEGGVCYQGACFPASCGNGRRELDEVCDDGNLTSADGCSADCSSTETCGNGIVDPVHGEACDDGPAGLGLSHDGCSSTCARETPAWAVAPEIDGLFGASGMVVAATYDVGRDRIVLVGGYDHSLEVLEWDGASWQQAAREVSPVERTGFSVAYDQERRRTVLFGGLGFDDTWEWDGSAWTLRQPAVSPPARGAYALAYDPIGRRVVLYGGRTSFIGANSELGDTWTWDGDTWTQLNIPSPPPRSDATMAFDPKRGVLVLFGGSDVAADRLDETWELAGTTWTRRFPASAPPPRVAPALGYDARTGVILLHGGRDGGVLGDTWSWDGTAWTPRTTGLPAGRTRMVAHAAHGSAVLMVDGATYRWTGSSWEVIAPTIPGGMPARTLLAGATSPEGHVVVHGGRFGPLESSVTYVWNGAWAPGASPTPGALVSAGMAYDVRRREFVLFGGDRAGNVLGETWVLNASGWTQRTPATSPPARSAHVMVYDAARERVVMFGGRALSGPIGDTWTWDGTTWTPASPATSPSPRCSCAATYDPVRERVVVFGGDTSGQGATVAETWTWNGSSWERMLVPGPSARLASAMAWDAPRRRAVLFGGANASGKFNDVWEWDGAGWAQLPVPASIRPRSDHLLVPSIHGAGVLSIGGDDPSFNQLDEVAWLRWRSASAEEVCVRQDLDGDGLGPAACGHDPDCWSVCTPACPPGATHVDGCGPTAARCGDGVCGGRREACSTCPEDCGVCPPRCGDHVCDATESSVTCPGDCA